MSASRELQYHQALQYYFSKLLIEPYVFSNNCFYILDEINGIVELNTKTKTIRTTPSSGVDKIIPLPGVGFAIMTSDPAVKSIDIKPQRLYISIWRQHDENFVEPFEISSKYVKNYHYLNPLIASPDNRYIACQFVEKSEENPAATAKIWIFDTIERKEMICDLDKWKDGNFPALECRFTGPTQICLIKKPHFSDHHTIQLFDLNSEKQMLTSGLSRVINNVSGIYPSPDGRHWLLRKSKGNHKKTKLSYYLLDMNSFFSEPKKIYELSYDSGFLADGVERSKWIGNTILFVKHKKRHERTFDVYHCEHEKLYELTLPGANASLRCEVTENNELLLLYTDGTHRTFSYPDFTNSIDKRLVEHPENATVTPFMNTLDKVKPLPRPIQRLIQEYAYQPMTLFFHPVETLPETIKIRNIHSQVSQWIERLTTQQKSLKLPSTKDPKQLTSAEKEIIKLNDQLTLDLKALELFQNFYAGSWFKLILSSEDHLKKHLEKIVTDNPSLSYDLLQFFKHLHHSLVKASPEKIKIATPSIEYKH
ncbi:MAG: hypothetical protein ACYCQI_12390 [Gammaproteobacteria bacterium]